MSREGPGNFGCSAAAAGGHFSKRGTMLPDCNVPGRIHCGVLPALRHRWSAWDFCGNDCRKSPFLFLNDVLRAISRTAVLPVIPTSRADRAGDAQHCIWQKEPYKKNKSVSIISKSKKCRTESVSIRPPLFGIHLIQDVYGTFSVIASLHGCRFITQIFRLIELTVVQICIKSVLFHQTLMISGFND